VDQRGPVQAVDLLAQPRGREQNYYLRKIVEGKTPAEARRALKRRLSNVVYRIMKRDQRSHLAQAA